MKQRKLILIGGGGHCKSCIDVIQLHGGFDISGILDVPEKTGTMIYGFPVIGTDQSLDSFVNPETEFLITIGQIKSAALRTAIHQKLKQAGARLATVVSPRATVSPSARIGNGTIILHHALVNADAVIGENCIINTGAIVEHDVSIGSNVHLSTGAIVNGSVIVGDGTFIGSGTMAANNIAIGKNVIIGAGSVVIRSISEEGTYAGNPCRKIR